MKTTSLIPFALVLLFAGCAVAPGDDDPVADDPADVDDEPTASTEQAAHARRGCDGAPEGRTRCTSAGRHGRWYAAVAVCRKGRWAVKTVCGGGQECSDPPDRPAYCH